MSTRQWRVTALLAVMISAFVIVIAIGRASSHPAVPVQCQQYDLFDSSGNLVPNPDLPLWLRHQAALQDHCPVSPSWGSLQSDHTQIN